MMPSMGLDEWRIFNAPKPMVWYGLSRAQLNYIGCNLINELLDATPTIG